MLEKIVFYNYKSFKERTEISFYKTNYGMLPHNVTDNGVLKGIVFVGSNAAGKTNVISAIKFLLDSLFGNYNINSDIFLCLFSEKESFTIEYYFLINGEHIIYNLDINPKKPFIVETLLLEDSILFQRIGQNARSYIANEEGQVFDENDIDKETLFLRTLYFNTKFASNDTLRTWMEFLSNSVYLNAHTRITTAYGRNNRDLMLAEYLNKYGDTEINEFYKECNFNQKIEYCHEAKSGLISIVAGSDESEKYVFFRRKDLEVPIPFSQESMGNQNLLHMLPPFFHVINNGGILLIDEFSSGFHNELEALLVRYFMEKSENSQMIFTTHSTNLLSNSLLRPDQEYVVEFDGKRGSVVKRFSSEGPRAAQNVEKMYLDGVFGGLPGYRMSIGKNILLGNGINSAMDVQQLYNEEILKRYKKTVIRFNPVFKNLFSVSMTSKDVQSIVGDDYKEGIEKWAGKLYKHIRNEYGKTWTANDELRLLDVLISIAITTIFYDDSGKIKAMDSIKRMPVFDDYSNVFSLNYYEFWDTGHIVNHLHGWLDFNNLPDAAGVFLSSKERMNLPEYRAAIEEMRATGEDYNIDSFSLVFSPEGKDKEGLIYVTGLYPNDKLYPAEDLFIPKKKDLYKKLRRVKELELFGVSPYGDQALIDVLNKMDFVKVYVYQMEKSEETAEWERILKCRHELVDSGEMDGRFCNIYC